MKKQLIVLLLISLCLSFCKEKKESPIASMNSTTDFQVEEFSEENIVMPNYNLKGMLMGYIDFPSEFKWEQDGAVTYLENTESTKIHLPKYIWNPVTHGINKNGSFGLIEKPIKTIDEIIDSIVVQNPNNQVLQNFQYDEISKKKRSYDTLLVSFEEPEILYESKIMEWKDIVKDTNYLMLVEYSKSKYGKHYNWGYKTQIIEAPSSYAEKAKKLFMTQVSKFSFCYDAILKYNLNQIYYLDNYGNLPENRNTAQYFPPKEKQRRKVHAENELKRTGTPDTGLLEDYLQNLNEKVNAIGVDIVPCAFHKTNFK